MSGDCSRHHKTLLWNSLLSTNWLLEEETCFLSMAMAYKLDMQASVVSYTHQWIFFSDLIREILLIISVQALINKREVTWLY